MAGTRLIIQGTFTVFFFALVIWAAKPVLFGTFPCLRFSVQQNTEFLRFLKALPDKITTLRQLLSTAKTAKDSKAETEALLPWYHVSVTVLLPEHTHAVSMGFDDGMQHSLWEQLNIEAYEVLSRVASIIRPIMELSFDLRAESCQACFDVKHHTPDGSVNKRELKRWLDDHLHTFHHSVRPYEFLTPDLLHSGYFSSLLNGKKSVQHNLSLTIVLSTGCIAQHVVPHHGSPDPYSNKNTKYFSEFAVKTDQNIFVALWRAGCESTSNFLEALVQKIVFQHLLKCAQCSHGSFDASFASAQKTIAAQHVPVIYERNLERLLQLISMIHLHGQEMTLSTKVLLEVERCFSILSTLTLKDDSLSRINLKQLHTTSLILDRLFHTENTEVVLFYPKSRFILPRDQTMAIMSPLVLPLILPLLLGLAREVKRYREKVQPPKISL